MYIIMGEKVHILFFFHGKGDIILQIMVFELDWVMNNMRIVNLWDIF